MNKRSAIGAAVVIFLLGVSFGWHWRHPLVTFAQTHVAAMLDLTNAFTGTNTFGTINNVIVVDGTKYTTIQGALNAVTSPGSEVFVPCGTYTLASGLSWYSVPINLHGEDRNCTILNFTITTGAGITPYDGSAIHGFDIRGANSGTAIAINAGATVWSTSTGYTTANDNVSPTLPNANGLIFKETVASCTSSSSTEPAWPTVLGGTVSGDGTCAWIAYAFAPLNIYDNIVEQWGGQGYNSGGGAYGDDVHDNIFRNGLTEAVLLGIGSQKITVTNNTFDNFATDGVDINGIKHAIIGNHFSHIGQGSSTADRTAINLASVTGATVTDIKVIGNDIYQAGTGIHTTGNNGNSMSRIVIAGNTIDTPSGTGNAGDGIDIDCGSGSTMTYNDIVIYGNTVLNAQRYGYCINTGGTSGNSINNVSVIGNAARGSTSGDFNFYSVSGAPITNAYVAGNQFASSTPYPGFTDYAAAITVGQNDPPLNNGSYLVGASFPNSAFLSWRNSAGTAALPILEVDVNNSTQLRGSGGTTSFQVMNGSGTTELGMTDAGAFSFKNSFGFTNLSASATAPTISTHFNTSGDSITANGTASFVITVGTGAGTNTGAIALPTATTGWNCWLTNTNRADLIQQTGSSTTSATFTNYGTTFAATNWTGSDVLRGGCTAY